MDITIFIHILQKLYNRHKEMKTALDKQLAELEEKKRRLEIERTKKKGFTFNK
jgi:septin 7